MEYLILAATLIIIFVIYLIRSSLKEIMAQSEKKPDRKLRKAFYEKIPGRQAENDRRTFSK